MAQARLDKNLATAGHWRITQIGAELLPEDTLLSIHFDGPKAVFFGGCNTIQTVALFGANSFRFDVGGMTKKHCGDEVMALEAALLEVISEVDLLSVPEAGALGFYNRGNKLVMAALRVEQG